MNQDRTVESLLSAGRTRAHLLISKLARHRGIEELADDSLAKAWEASNLNDDSTALRYGNLALRRNQTKQAIDAFSRAVSVRPDNAFARYKLGIALERYQDWANADIEYQQAQDLSYEPGRVSFRRGRCLSQMNEPEKAIAQYRIALRNRYREGDSYLAIFECESAAPVWKKLETLREGTKYQSKNSGWLRDRAVLAAKMGCHSEAVEFFERSDEVSSLARNDRIDMALSYQEIGQTQKAAELLVKMAQSESRKTQAIGPGAFFKERGRWAEAITQFQLKLEGVGSASTRSLLEFEIGHAFDRQYKWTEARHWFQRSLVTEGTNAYRHYRLGVAQERLGNYEAALGPYARAIELEPQKFHWYYRLGVSAAAAGRTELALESLARSIGGSLQSPPDSIQSEADGTELVKTDWSLLREIQANYSAELVRERQQQRPAFLETWQESLELARATAHHSAEFRSLREIARRKNHMNQSDTVSYAKHLHSNNETAQALRLLSNTRDYKFPDGLDLKRYTKTRADRRRSLFAEYQKTLPIDETLVLMESNHGVSIGCHPLALFRSMCEDSRFRGFTFVWSYSADAIIPEEIASKSNVILAEVHSGLYLKYLATAKYLVNNVSFAPYFVRRQGQTYLNTWHGTPLKTLGRSMKQGLLEYENLARNFVQATHVASPNELTDWALFDDHRISRYALAKRRITGSPRLDRLINDGQTLRSKIRALLGVTCDEKLLLYAPTWRGGVSSHDFDVERLFQDLKAMSHTAGTRVFFRAHRLTEKFVNNLSLPVDVVPNEIDSSDLLAAVDILVTDYSSIAFDFLPTRRHLIFYVPDYNEYIESRGLYIDIDSLPGRVCHDHKSLIDSIADSSGSMLDAYDAAIERYAPMEDGNASARTIDFMLESDVAQSRSRPLVVFHASLIPNGIATALLALLRRLGSHKVDVVLVVEAHVMRREPGRQAMLAKLPEYVDLAFRIDEITATPEERWAISRAKSLESLGSTAMREVLDVAWRREGYRVLGAVVPDTVIEFDGYADLWADFVANLGDESTTRLIWQHNQLAEERRTKYPELARVFKRYDQFSAIVPVAESLATENQRQLSLEGFQTSTPYVPVTNLLDTERIKSAAAEPLSSDVDKWMTPDAFNVISIGRLSPEKNFGALIDAWPAIVSAVPNARLTIIGSGLLEAELQTRVEQLGIGNAVLFAGQRENPYSALRAADLFVLPSVHEGQPVVVLEAMTLGVPVAAAYTPGTAELIEQGYGEIISANSCKMAENIINILKNPDRACGYFDIDNYLMKSEQAFWSLAFPCDVDGR